MSPRPTAHQVLRRTAALTARRAVVVAAALVAVVSAPGHGVLDTSGSDTSHVTRAERIVTENDCWSGAAPAGVEPGHAVVTLPGHAARLVPAKVGYGIWLEHDPGVLHAFCR